MILKRFTGLVQRLVQKIQTSSGPTASNEQIIIEPSVERLADNIKILSGASFTDDLTKVDSALKTAPINFAVSNHFANDSKLTPLKDYLKLRVDKKKFPSVIFRTHDNLTSLCEDLDEYMTRLNRGVAPELQNAQCDEDLHGLVKGFAAAIFNRCSNHKLSIEIRCGTSERGFYPHVDGTIAVNAENTKDRIFNGQEIKAIMPLANISTAIFDNKDIVNGRHIDFGEHRQLKGLFEHTVMPCGAAMHDKPSWHLPPLGIGFFPCSIWTHMPAVHSIPCHPKGVKENRALLIAHVTPEGDLK